MSGAGVTVSGNTRSYTAGGMREQSRNPGLPVRSAAHVFTIAADSSTVMPMPDHCARQSAST